LISEPPEGWRVLSSGERVAFAIFALTTAQVAFLCPYVAVIPGERANVFSGILCLISLAGAVLTQRARLLRFPTSELVISLVLPILVCLSGCQSAIPQSSLFRGFVLVASGLGGFWCSRLLLATPSSQALFLRLSYLILVLLLLLSLLSCSATGTFHAFLDGSQHPLFSRFVLLSFAPLTLFLREDRPRKVLALLFLGLIALVLFLSRLRSAVLMPVLLGAVAYATGRMRWTYLLGLLVVAALSLPCFFHFFPERKFGLTEEYEPVYYRIENYPFSWHIAVRNPWFGNGLRSPRTHYLEKYQLKYPYVTRKSFRESTERTVVSENILLTFMADLGFPFVILYSASLLVLFVRLIGCVHHPPPAALIPPLALLLPLTGAFFHFMIFDGLLHPQVCWFFHVILGLIPMGISRTSTVSVRGLGTSTTPLNGATFR